jgi:ANTAR domain/GAF domain
MCTLIKEAPVDSPPLAAVTDLDGLTELPADFARTAQTLFSAGSVSDTLARVVELAVATIEGCDYAGLIVAAVAKVTTPVSTDPIVDQADALQVQSGEGPCLDALTHRAIFYAIDLETDVRWPRFASEVTKLGLRSMLALPLPASPSEGTVNLYAHYPAAFGAVDRAKATILATMAGLALTMAHSREDQERRIDHLIAALESRGNIGEAIGILIERERITSNQALNILRLASQRLNIKVRVVAQNLVDTGERPETGPK